MSQELGIPITLDRPRTLLLNVQAILVLRDVCGVAVDPASMFHQEMTLEFTRQCIWAGCVTSDPRLTYHAVCKLITEANAVTFHEAIARALCRGLGMTYQPTQPE